MSENIRQNISVVVQGPIDNRTYEVLDCYKNFKEIIISTWYDNKLHSVLPEIKNNNYKLVVSEYPKQNMQITGYQAMTTYRGALLATGKYVMKTRSDELYPDLNYMIDSLEKNPDKSHTTNNGFWKNLKHCYSNHLFIDKTNFVIKAMEELYEYHLNLHRKTLNFPCSESEFGYFLMKARGFNIIQDDWKSIFKKNIIIVPCTKLQGHLHSGATTEHEGFSRSTEPYPLGRKETKQGCHDINKLYNSIEEII
tara:strand:- start:7235 stop:7990 length:756 start_codon:yes stop_codon:yes gene_type:complete